MSREINIYKLYNIDSLATGPCPVCLQRKGHYKKCAIRGWSENDRRAAIKNWIDKQHKK